MRPRTPALTYLPKKLRRLSLCATKARDHFWHISDRAAMTDGDVVIDTNDLRIFMCSQGRNPTEAELQDMISAFDTNGDGVIDLPEFSAMVREIHAPDSYLSEEQAKEPSRPSIRTGTVTSARLN